MKRELAEVIVKRAVEVLGEAVEEAYYVDLHGGEPANFECMGDKDVDLILKLSEKPNIDLNVFEEVLEEEVSNILSEILGFNVKDVVGVPNIVELHIVEEGSRSYVDKILYSKQTPPILIWRR